MKVLIIGGAGFVGTHLAVALHRAGAEVVVGDVRQGPGPPQAFGWIPLNVLNGPALLQAMENVDVVMHLAAVSNTGDALADVWRATNVTCLGTANVLEAALEADVQRVVLASSSLISGMLDTFEMHWPEDCYEWQDERADDRVITRVKTLVPWLEPYVTDELSPVNVTQAHHPYTTTKLFQEMLARDYARSKGLDVTILRYGIMYGEGMTPGVVVEQFIRRALDRQPLLIHGDGQQWRQYLHVEDLVRAHVAVLERWNASRNETFNLTPPYKTTIAELAEAVCVEIPGTKVEYMDARAVDVPMKFCLADRAKQKLGWWPKIALPEGMHRTVEWYKEELGRT